MGSPRIAIVKHDNQYLRPPTFPADILETLGFVRRAVVLHHAAKRRVGAKHLSPLQNLDAHQKLQKSRLRLDAEVEGLLSVLEPSA